MFGLNLVSEQWARGTTAWTTSWQTLCSLLSALGCHARTALWGLWIWTHLMCGARTMLKPSIPFYRNQTRSTSCQLWMCAEKLKRRAGSFWQRLSTCTVACSFATSLAWRMWCARQEKRIWGPSGMLWPRAPGGPAGRGLCRRRMRTAVSLRSKGFPKAGGPSRRTRGIGTSLSNTWRRPRRGETAVPAHNLTFQSRRVGRN